MERDRTTPLGIKRQELPTNDVASPQIEAEVKGLIGGGATPSPGLECLQDRPGPLSPELRKATRGQSAFSSVSWMVFLRSAPSSKLATAV